MIWEHVLGFHLRISARKDLLKFADNQGFLGTQGQGFFPCKEPAFATFVIHTPVVGLVAHTHKAGFIEICRQLRGRGSRGL